MPAALLRAATLAASAPAHADRERRQVKTAVTMATASPERVRAVVAPVVASAGFDLEDVSMRAAGRRRILRISVDRDGGISMDDVALVSQQLSQVLDETDVMGGQPYVLEVGSPGVDRPLTEPRHWRRASGRLVEAVLADGTTVTGRVQAVEHADVVLDLGEHDRRVAISDVRRALVQVEFGRTPTDAGPGRPADAEA
jgi:ribosome maturation factor RimP